MLRRLCSRANPSRARWYPTTVPSGWAPAIANALVNAGLGVNPRGGATRVAAATGRAPLVAACTSGRDPAFTPSAGPLAPAFARTLSGWTHARGGGRASPTAAAAAKGQSKSHGAEIDVREVLKGLPSICPGCGVGLQCEDKNGPGYFVVPKRLLEPERDADDERGRFVADPRAAAAADDVLNFDEDEDDDDLEDEDGLDGMSSFAVEGLGDEENKRLKSINAKIVEIRLNRIGDATVYLENGQVWRQLDSDNKKLVFGNSDRLLTAKVKRGIMGNYMLTVNELRRTIRVERIK